MRPIKSRARASHGYICLPRPSQTQPDEGKKEENPERRRRKRSQKPFLVVLGVLARSCCVLFISSVPFCASVLHPDAGNPPSSRKTNTEKEKLEEEEMIPRLVGAQSACLSLAMYTATDSARQCRSYRLGRFDGRAWDIKSFLLVLLVTRTRCFKCRRTRRACLSRVSKSLARCLSCFSRQPPVESSSPRRRATVRFQVLCRSRGQVDPALTNASRDVGLLRSASTQRKEIRCQKGVLFSMNTG